jgi:antitoxin CptB
MMLTVDPVFLERVRWRCRRGMLEMDILLARFIEQRYAQMDERQRVAFDELLDLPDTDLWDLVRGEKEPEQARQREVLEWLKQV